MSGDRLCRFLALPLTNIYNSIIQIGIWPAVWKREYVTVIPKKKMPGDVNDLRNISCTALVSKGFESFFLGYMKRELSLKRNQFGGVKDAPVEHLLCNIWHDIGTNLEDHRAATVLNAIDYAKAFNRLCYKSCLQALAAKDVSSQVLALVATFLTNQTMTLRVGEDWSTPREITGESLKDP